MKTKHIIPALLIGATPLASAQNRQGPPPPDPIARALDKNGDRELSSREISSATRSLLKLDKDKSNSIGAEELAPPERPGDDDQQNRRPAPKASELMRALDTDNSGELSKAELTVASDSILTLDKNKDRKITFDEASSLGDPDEESSDSSGRPPGGGPPGGGPPPRQ